MVEKIKKTFNLLIIIILFLVYSTASNAKPLVFGDEKAKVTVRVFSSLTCPHCADLHEELFYNLKKDFIDSKKVKFIHHSFPLDYAALNAEKMLRCSNDPIKIFELMGEIYKKQSQWANGSDIEKINTSLIKIGESLNFNKDELKSCINNNKIQKEILNDRIKAQSEFEISSTPTIYINNKKFKDKLKYKIIKNRIEKIL